MNEATSSRCECVEGPFHREGYRHEGLGGIHQHNRIARWGTNSCTPTGPERIRAACSQGLGTDLLGTERWPGKAFRNQSFFAVSKETAPLPTACRMEVTAKGGAPPRKGSSGAHRGPDQRILILHVPVVPYESVASCVARPANPAISAKDSASASSEGRCWPPPSEQNV